MDGPFPPVDAVQLDLAGKYDVLERASMSTIGVTVRPEITWAARQPRAAYDDLLRAVDAYLALLDGEIAAESVQPSPDGNKLPALQMQRGGAGRLRETLENHALDDLIRFSDRVIRLTHWEDGVFL